MEKPQKITNRSTFRRPTSQVTGHQATPPPLPSRQAQHASGSTVALPDPGPVRSTLPRRTFSAQELAGIHTEVQVHGADPQPAITSRWIAKQRKKEGWRLGRTEYSFWVLFSFATYFSTSLSFTAVVLLISLPLTALRLRDQSLQPYFAVLLLVPLVSRLLTLYCLVAPPKERNTDPGKYWKMGALAIAWIAVMLTVIYITDQRLQSLRNGISY